MEDDILEIEAEGDDVVEEPTRPKNFDFLLCE